MIAPLKPALSQAVPGPGSAVFGHAAAASASSFELSPHPLTLRFGSPEVERSWWQHDNQASLGRIRVTLAMALMLYAVFAWLDLLIAPEVASAIGRIRVVVCVLMIVVFAATGHPAFGRWRHLALGGTILGTGGGIIGMLAMIPGRVESLYFAGLILVVMATHAFRWLPFPGALGVSLAVVLGYDIQLYLKGGLEPALIINNHFFSLSALLLGAVASYSSERHARMNFLHTRRLDAEKALNEALLEDIFPAPVARRLRMEPGPVAERFEDVSVMFIDMVDFTTSSADLEPETLVDELNTFFHELDDLARAHGVEKIKTMGDAYLAVTGLPLPRADHAEHMAEMALGVLAHFARRRPGSLLPERLRIGIACGTVVAGVIGRSKPTYDLWGEPVTLASRMQAHGAPNRIQVTDAFRQRLAHAYDFEYRGLVDVKGRGPMPTWWLLGRKTLPEASGQRAGATLASAPQRWDASGIERRARPVHRLWTKASFPAITAACIESACSPT